MTAHTGHDVRNMPEYLVVCAWRSVKEVSLLLGQLTSTAPVTDPSMADDPVSKVTDPSKADDPVSKVTDPSGNVNNPVSKVTDPSKADDPVSKVTDPSGKVVDPVSKVTDPSGKVVDPSEHGSCPADGNDGLLTVNLVS